MAVKDDHYLALLRAMMQGDLESARSLARIEASRTTHSRPMFARNILRTIDNGTKLVELKRRGKWEFGKSVTKLDDLVMTDDVDKSVRRLIHQHKLREQLAAHGLAPVNKILLEGPPGNGKTSLAMALANAINLPIARISCHDVIASHLGESGGNLKDLFRSANESPSLLFLDEIDGLSMSRGMSHSAAESERTSITTSLFILLDQMLPQTILVAATNRSQDLDPALIRRFEVRVEIKAPSELSVSQWLNLYRNRWWPDMPRFDRLNVTSFAFLESETKRRHREWVIEQLEKGAA